MLVLLFSNRVSRFNPLNTLFVLFVSFVVNNQGISWSC